LKAGGHHLSNVLLHLAVAILLFLVLRQMTQAFWRSAFVAALFAIHPLRVESVAWIAERKDVLSGLFFMLTLWAYVRYASRPESIGRYALVVVFCPWSDEQADVGDAARLSFTQTDWPLKRLFRSTLALVDSAGRLSLACASSWKSSSAGASTRRRCVATRSPKKPVP
jgi:hypothetical protein